MKPPPRPPPHRPERGTVRVGRRTLLRGATGLFVAWMTPVLSAAQTDRTTGRPAKGDLLVKVGDATLTPLTIDDIPTTAPLMAWPMNAADQIVRSGSRLNRVLLVRLDREALATGTRSLAAGNVVAYSAICTHSGCDVGGWIADAQQLYCECHESKFDPRDGARVTDGPAPRSLPALPIEVVDGVLVVARPFTSRVGFTEG